MRTDPRPVRALVLWADNQSANLGVRALAQGTAAFARMAWGADTVVDFQDFKGSESDVAFSKQTLLRDALLPGSPVLAKVNRYDVVLDSGAGDSFTDIYGLKRMAAIMYTQHRVASSGARLILGPQTIGPFDSPVSRAAARAILRRCDGVLARDHASFAYATELGRTPDSLATDVVFALDDPAPRADRRDVIINVSGLLWNQNPHVDHTLYRRSVVRLGTELLLRGRHLTLVAHVLDNPSTDNDVPAVLAAAGALRGNVEVSIPTDLDDARAVISSAQVVVGARMHACLNALSLGVPAVPWAYSRKFAPLLDDLGWTQHVDLRADLDPVATTLALLPEVESARSRATAAGIVDTARHVLQRSAAALAPTCAVQHG